MEKAEQSLEPPTKRKWDICMPHHMCFVNFPCKSHGTFKLKDENTKAKFDKIFQIKKQRLE